MKYVVYGLIALLLIIHQDFWFWEDKTLLFGFMPIGLFYHACISVAASITWYLATIYCWPVDEEEVIAQAEEQAGGEA